MTYLHGATWQRFACGSVGLCDMGLGSYVFADRFPREEAKAAVDTTTATEVQSVLFWDSNALLY
jgi:hypothetical protein